MFYNYVWRDLRDSREDPMYVSEWSGVIPGMMYRVACNRCGENPDDGVYVFCSNSSARMNNNEGLELKFVFQWSDMCVLDMFFIDINKMFKWCNRYNSVRVRLFDPEMGDVDKHHLTPPPCYNH